MYDDFDNVQSLLQSISTHYQDLIESHPEVEALRQRLAQVKTELLEEQQTSQRLLVGVRAALETHTHVVEAHNALLEANEEALKRAREDLSQPERVDSQQKRQKDDFDRD